MEPPEKPTGNPQRITIGPAIEHDTALPLGVSKSVSIKPALEVDQAMPLAVSPAYVIVYAVVTDHGYHLSADHKDLVAYGTELLLVVAFIFVAGKLVARRLFRSE